MVVVVLFVCLFLHSYAQSVGAAHYTASAKQNKGIQELFLDLSKSKLITLEPSFQLGDVKFDCGMEFGIEVIVELLKYLLTELELL